MLYCSFIIWTSISFVNILFKTVVLQLIWNITESYLCKCLKKFNGYLEIFTVSPEKDKNQGGQDTALSSNIVPSHVETYLLRQCPRRGSAPADSPLTLTMPVTGERRDLLTRHTSLNGKASRRKKQLRRRSSGGPETVCAQEALGQDVWHRLRRDLSRRTENPDLLLARRRGSLPIEMLTVGHSGNYYYY